MVTQSLLFLRHFRGTKLGKMVMSVVACLKVFVYWAIIAVFVWIPYAFLQHNVRYPNRIVKNYDSKFKLVNGSWELSGEGRYRQGSVFSLILIRVKLVIRKIVQKFCAAIFSSQKKLTVDFQRVTSVYHQKLCTFGTVTEIAYNIQ